MSRGQFYTVFTLGFAAAIGLVGIAGAIVLLWWPQAAYWAAGAFSPVGGPRATWLSPNVFSVMVVGASLSVAYWIVGIQQAIVRWAADRAVAKLSRQHNEIAQRHGCDQADEFMRLQTLSMLEGDAVKRFDLFGREEMLRSLAAAGVKVPAR